MTRKEEINVLLDDKIYIEDRISELEEELKDLRIALLHTQLKLQRLTPE